MLDEKQMDKNRSVETGPSETAMATATLRALGAQDERLEIRCSDHLAELFLSEEHKAPLRDRELASVGVEE